jgi:hypothetical protein
LNAIGPNVNPQPIAVVYLPSLAEGWGGEPIGVAVSKAGIFAVGLQSGSWADAFLRSRNASYGIEISICYRLIWISAHSS